MVIIDTTVSNQSINIFDWDLRVLTKIFVTWRIWLVLRVLYSEKYSASEFKIKNICCH